MGVLYYSTRGDKQAYTASQAILQGLAKDGGLFVPDALPKLDKTMEELSAMDYKKVKRKEEKRDSTFYWSGPWSPGADYGKRTEAAW